MYWDSTPFASDNYINTFVTKKNGLPDPVASLAGGLSGDGEQSSAILSESAIQTPSYIIHKEEAEGGRESGQQHSHVDLPPMLGGEV